MRSRRYGLDSASACDRRQRHDGGRDEVRRRARPPRRACAADVNASRLAVPMSGSKSTSSAQTAVTTSSGKTPRRQRPDALAFAREGGGQIDDERELGELRRLERQGARAEPTPRAAPHEADVRNEDGQ